MNCQWSREQKWNWVRVTLCLHHFPTDPNCDSDICLTTKITRAPRRRAGTVVPRAEHFGDLITADDKIISEGSESRDNHRYAVVVQDLATRWLQSYPCKTKTSEEIQQSQMKFLEPTRKPKVIPWSVTAICETFKISCLMGRHHMKGGSECPFKNQ